MSDEPIAIGIDFGGTGIKIGACRGAEVLAKADPIATADHPEPADLIAAMAAAANALIARFPDAAGVGAGVPGLVDFEGGHVHELTNVRGWIDIPLRDALSDACGLPAAVDNDANCMVFAEARHGAARGLANVVGVTLGTGIGGGIVLGGEIYRGSHCGAGEIGQMCIDHDGRPGHYGNPGAIEEYLGNGPIAEIAIERYRAAGIARDPAEWNAANAPRLLAEAAESGCPVALALWDEFAGWLAAMFGGVAWLLDPDAIVIGGGVAKAGDLLFKPLRDKMLPTLSPTLREHLRVVPAQFSNDAGMIGAAALGVWASRRAGD